MEADMEESMERVKHDGAAEPLPIIAVALSTKPAARPRRAVTTPPPISKLRAAREAVQVFLVAEFQAREVRITKIGPAPDDPEGWYVEAEILVSDLGIMTLGLPLSQEVFKRELCAIDLDSEMTVKSCEVLE
jgi:hypothetical protein